MSAKMSQIVWNQAPYKADRLLVLLAMAEWADDEGICCVSYDRLADKARIHKQGAIKIIRYFLKENAIQVVQMGNGRGNPTVYQLLPHNWRRKSRKNKPHTNSNSSCPNCNRTGGKKGLSRSGNQRFYCSTCKRSFTSTQQQLEQQQQLSMEQLLPLIAAKVPRELPPEVREEMIQELAVGVLVGEFELSQLDEMVTQYRRKVYRQSLTGFGYVSLDAVIPNTEGLTLGDTLAG
jgi:ribosomal protein L37AE/L43A